jgi:hypothetical protein
MQIIRRFSMCLILFLFVQPAFSQPNRIIYNNQQLFLNGANLAWVNFAGDVGSSTPPDTTTFGSILLQMHNHGGNAIRWWLHTNGSVTPQFSSADSSVIGPGAHTISDMRRILDIAWQREIGVNICLWSFDMMNTSNSTLVLAQNKKLLSDTNYTRAYIKNCLIPMVDSLKDHPAILSWEIFNEPEGMSTEYGGFGSQNLVSMSIIERFINLCAGAIHRADPKALVTSGAWSFYALSDAPLAKARTELSKLSSNEKLRIAASFQQKYRSSLTPDEIMIHLDKMAAGPRTNYYRDDRLIAAGGDPDGILDFYSVHYYSTSTPVSTSPFNNPVSTWGLNKPIVVAEFGMDSGNPPIIPKANLFETLYQLGYAGALPWSFTDAHSSPASMLAGMQSMWDTHRADVDVNGIAVDWPTITITSPQNSAQFPDSTQITIRVMVVDTLSVNSIDFFVAGTQKIGSVVTRDSIVSDTSYYTFEWKNIPAGQYALKAVAINSYGHQGVSNSIQLSFGKPPMTRLEAEAATLKGAGITRKSEATASKGSYIDMATSDTNATVTFRFINLLAAGNYPITFGYRLNYQSPKTQYINVNGVRADTVVFTAASTLTWYEQTLNVDLKQDTNTIQMQMFWGYMSLDYLAVPTNIVTSVKNTTNMVPTDFSLQQNYPNPFNPATTINFNLGAASNVKLTIYNVLGQKVATLIDSRMSAGQQSVVFDASKISSGVYFYRLDAGSFSSIKKMMLLK